jgi:ankyrin repeat protein
MGKLSTSLLIFPTFFKSTFNRIVKLLIENKANVKEKTIDGLNSLHLAIRSGSDNSDLVRVLVEAGADVNGRTNAEDTPLHYSSFMGYENSARALLDAGADKEARGQNFSTPMHFASREGKLGVLKLLIERNADLNSKDKDGDTPFQCSQINGHTKCIEVLKAALTAAGYSH